MTCECFWWCISAILWLRNRNHQSPHTMLIIVAGSRGKIKKGITKLNATKNFVKNVASPAIQISFFLFPLSDSSETKTPIASANASATAIVKIPHIITDFMWLPEPSPTISHNVVMIHEVTPKVIPALTDFFIIFFSKNKDLMGLRPEYCENFYTRPPAV